MLAANSPSDTRGSTSEGEGLSKTQLNGFCEEVAKSKSKANKKIRVILHGGGLWGEEKILKREVAGPFISGHTHKDSITLVRTPLFLLNMKLICIF